MARKMRNVETGSVVTVHGWAATANSWEYYWLDKVAKGGVRFALVHGFETEMGDVDIREIRPYIMMTCKEENLDDIAPAVGYEWVD